MALWTPTDYGAPVAAWYDASDAATITQTSGAVSQWNDKTANSRHLAQATSFRQPTYSTTTFPGSLPGISFATDDVLSNLAISGITGGTRINVFTAMTMTSGSAGNARIFSTANTGDDDAVFIPLLRNAGTQQVATFVGGFRQGTAIVYGQAHVVSSIQNSASVQVRVDGTGATADSVTPSSTVITRWAIGDKVGSSGGDSLTGKIAELVVVTGDLSLADEQLFEGYLAWKWGIQSALPSGHTYKSAAPTTGGADSSVAEAATAANTITSVLAAVAASTNAATATEATTGLAAYPNAISEAATAAETSTGGRIIAAAAVETGAASEATTALLSGAGISAEAAVASEATDASTTAGATRTEAVTASDATDASTTVGANNYSVAITEAVTLADSAAMALTVAASASESVSLNNAASVAQNFACLASETALAADSTAAVLAASAAASEAVVAFDLVSGAWVFVANASESISASDQVRYSSPTPEWIKIHLGGRWTLTTPLIGKVN